MSSDEAGTRSATDTATAESDPAAAPTSVQKGRQWHDYAYRYTLLLVLLGMIVIFAILLPRTFPTFNNLRTVAGTQAVLIIVALGLTFPLNAGEFDLSFGGVLGLASTMVAVLTVNMHWSIWPALLLTFAACLAIGAMNGVIVIRLGVNSLITTLGMGTLLSGVTLLIANNQVIAGGTGLLSD